MTLVISVWLFLFGAVIGSFLNVMALRWGKRSFVTGRSSCPYCTKALGALELIPLVSYVLQRGRCRSCKYPLSLRYPAVELATGAAFVLVYRVLMPTLAPLDVTVFAAYLVIACILIVITLYDLEHLIIPDQLVYTFSALAGVLLFIDLDTMTFMLPALWDILAGPLLFLPFFALWHFSNGTWIGLGDGKLAWGIGWLLGLAGGASAIVFSFWIGAIISLSYMAYQRLRAERASRRELLASSLWGSEPALTMKSEIPFGPYLIAGTVFVFTTGWTLASFIRLIG